jgi:hypothetical protein
MTRTEKIEVGLFGIVMIVGLPTLLFAGQLVGA